MSYLEVQRQSGGTASAYELGIAPKRLRPSKKWDQFESINNETGASASGTIRSVPTGHAERGAVDKLVLDRAHEILDGVDINDVVDTTVKVASFGAVICELWNNASAMTHHHKQILSAMDMGVLAILKRDEITNDHLELLRWGLADLGLSVVTESIVESIHSKMIDVGVDPFSILSGTEIESEDSNDE